MCEQQQQKKKKQREKKTVEMQLLIGVQIKGREGNSRTQRGEIFLFFSLALLFVRVLYINYSSPKLKLLAKVTSITHERRKKKRAEI
jgi:hypothetical protein